MILRHFWKHRIYSIVILLSLTAGFACAALLIAFISHEVSTDKFHEKHARIYQVTSNDPFRGTGRIPFVLKSFSDYAVSTYPEVEAACQLNSIYGAALSKDDVSWSNFMIVAADTTFFSLFDFPLALGNPDKCLAPGQIVLSQKTATALFGSEEALNKLVTFRTSDTTLVLSVSGVLDRQIQNSHLQFDALVHPSLLSGKWYVGVSYLLLRPHIDSGQFVAKLNGDSRLPGFTVLGNTEYFLNSLSTCHFNTDSKVDFIKTRNRLFITIVGIVCAVILFIASFNSINLFLLLGRNRRKEIGVKRIFGTTTRHFVGFATLEIGFYSLFSLALAGLIIVLIIPTFNSIFGSTLSVEYFLWADVTARVAVILFLSSSILVGVISHKQWQMKPAELVNNKLSKIRFNRGLFTLQFAISTILATCSITIVEQINHIETAPLGFSRNLIQLGAPGFEFSNKFPALKHRALQLPDVNGVTITGGNPISSNSIVRLELEDGSSYSPYLFVGDEDLVNTMQLELIEGSVPSSQNDGNLVNETLVRMFDMKDPIGKATPGTEGKIVGIVRDFTIGSFREPIPPVIISSYKEEGKALLINYTGNDLKGLLAQLRSEWERVFPNDNFDYRIIQEDLMEGHKEDIFLFRVVTLFSVISIVLSCFGLFALSWAVTQNRRKEIGIRKVLGATPKDVLQLVTLSFAKRVAVAFVIAVPVGYYLMNKWLSGFVKKIDLGPEIFIMSAIIMTIVSAITLSFQTLQAAFTNPVQEIRREGE